MHALVTETDSVEFVGAYQSTIGATIGSGIFSLIGFRGVVIPIKDERVHTFNLIGFQGSNVALLIWPERALWSCCFGLLNYRGSTVCRVMTTAEVDRLMLLTEGRSSTNKIC